MTVLRLTRIWYFLLTMGFTIAAIITRDWIFVVILFIVFLDERFPTKFEISQSITEIIKYAKEADRK